MTGTQALQRKLTVILAADVVGYSRLMEQDEAGTLARLQANRQNIVMPRLASHGGRVVKLMGDGSLVEFASVVSAVACAVEIQNAMAESELDLAPEQRIRYRIGINLGDVIVQGDDLYGDGVNVAARLQSLAPVGGITLSAPVQQQVSGKIAIDLEDLGDQALKNFERPVRIYSVRSEGLAKAETFLAPSSAAADPGQRLALCVLPFTNMSGDLEQEYFSDGISEDIITDLSKISSLFVVSRNTAFSFKGKQINLGQVARQLGVKYVLEGSVRKAGGRVRITAQLIDGASDRHIWAERYDRNLDDIFALQDEISAAIVEALRVKLLPEEKKAISQRSTTNPEAYQMLLLARHYVHTSSPGDTKAALRIAQRAVAIDPGYAEAWATIASCQIKLHEWFNESETGLDAAERALALDPSLSVAHATKGRVLCGIGRYDEALAEHAKALYLDPEGFDAHYLYGRTCTHIGKADLAIRHLEKAAALSPEIIAPLTLVSQSYKSLGQIDAARDASRRAFERIESAMAKRPDNTSALFAGAAVLADLGQRDRAIEWANRACLIAPEDYVGIYNVACAFALLGEAERSIDALEQSLAGHKHQNLLEWIRNDSDLDSLRDHPRFQSIIAKLKAGVEGQATP